MKAGEKLKYKARRYLYQLEQNINHNNQKKYTELKQGEKINTSSIEGEKKYYQPQKDEYDYYDVYYSDQLKQQGKWYNESENHYYNGQYNNGFEEYPTHNEYKSTKNNNILGALDDMEEYLKEKMDKFKK